VDVSCDILKPRNIFQFCDFATITDIFTMQQVVISQKMMLHACKLQCLAKIVT